MTGNSFAKLTVIRQSLVASQLAKTAGHWAAVIVTERPVWIGALNYFHLVTVALQ